MKSFSFASKDEIMPAWWAHEPCMPTFFVVACGCVFFFACDGVVGSGAKPLCHQDQRIALELSVLVLQQIQGALEKHFEVHL